MSMFVATRARTGFVLRLVLACAVWVMASGLCRAELVLVYNEKPPYFYTADGVAKGFLIDSTRRVFDKAGIAYRFDPRPFNRIMRDLQAGTPDYCAVGFSRTPEREKFVQFTVPIYKDRAPVLLVRRADAANFRRFKTLEAMLDGTTYVFGGKAGNTYPIDRQLESIGVSDIRINGETQALIQMLNASRFDFMMVFPEERDYLIRLAKLTGDSFEDIIYPDIPDGQARHLLCSTSLDAKTVEAINRAILAVVGKL